MSVTELLVDKANPHNITARTRDGAPLPDGAVRVHVDQFGFSANNVTYGAIGEMMGYWQFYPSGDAAYGILPVWGYGTITESKCAELPVGERLYGYLPCGSEAILQVGSVSPRGFSEVSAHRAALAAVYNNYTRVATDEPDWTGNEGLRMLLTPVFVTSFFLYDYELDNDCFGADQILVGSASSKTAIGMVQLLHDDPKITARVVGLTSPGNKAFVESLGCYDEVVTYDAISSMDANVPSAIVDMSGNGDVIAALHNHFKDALKDSCMVGITHWDASKADGQDLPGPTPEFFFAPAQIEKRNNDWGPGVALARSSQATFDAAMATKTWLKLNEVSGADDAIALIGKFLRNEVAPDQGYLVSL